MRDHDVSEVTAPELERTRRELVANLALVRPDSLARVPILAHLSAIDTERPGGSSALLTSYPQWSPPVKGGSTRGPWSRLFPLRSPQWSPPLKGGSTGSGRGTSYRGLTRRNGARR